MNNGGLQMKEERFTSGERESRKSDDESRSSKTEPSITPEQLRLKVEQLNVYYGDFQAVKDIDLLIRTNKVTALIGPSGCGKSTFIRCLNRMHEVTPGGRVEGRVLLDGQDLYGPGVDPVDVRRRVGMVFQKPNVFPSMSIHDNVASGYKLNGIRDHQLIAEKVQKSLKDAALWEEVKDKLKQPGTSLSGGQQQRLCIARALAVDPDVLADGRALLCARSHSYGQDRGADSRAEGNGDHRHCHAQYATGCAGIGLHGFFLRRRAGRVRRNRDAVHDAAKTPD